MNRNNQTPKEEELKEKLTPEQYHVMREKGTEMPWSGKYVEEKGEGIYSCAACGNPLFASDTKFDSGTGWPSFDQAIEGSVTFKNDTETLPGVNQTEVVCAKCGSHLGHIYDDGPTKTGKRYCMNSVCLNLEKN